MKLPVFSQTHEGGQGIAQPPNAPLIVAVAAAAAWSAGLAPAVSRPVYFAALGVWASLEIAFGVSPFRRLLGAAIFIGAALRG